MRQITRSKALIRFIGFSLLGICMVLFLAGVFHDRLGAQTQTAPKFKVDVSWPKPPPQQVEVGRRDRASRR